MRTFSLLSRNRTSPSETPSGPTSKVFFTPTGDNGSFQSGLQGIPGSTSKISGIVHIRYPSKKPLQVRAVSLSFSGTERTSWERSNGNISEPYTGETDIILMGKHLKLWSADSGDYEVVQSLDLPFEFCLPPDAPASLKTTKAAIQYVLSVYLDRNQNWYEPKVERVQLEVPIRRYSLPDQRRLQPVVWNSAEIVNPDSPDHDKVIWALQLPRTEFVRGDATSARLSVIFRDPQVNIRSARISLKTYVRLRCAGKDTTYLRSFRAWSREVPGEVMKTLPTTSAQSELVHELPFFIPDDVLPTCETTYISVRHKIKIKLSLTGGGVSDIDVEEPVEVKDIPTDDVALLDMHQAEEEMVVPSTPTALPVYCVNSATAFAQDPPAYATLVA